MLPRGKVMVDMATGNPKPSVKGKTNYNKIKIPTKSLVNLLEVNSHAANVAKNNLPAVNIAEVILPAADAAEVNLPAVDVADINLPAVDIAEIILPAPGVAELNLPAADGSEIILPAAVVAEINLPTADVADINLPAVDVAEVNLSTVDVTEINLPAVDDTDFLKGHLNDADDSDFHEGVLLPAKIQEKKSLPAVVVIESSSPVVAEQENFEHFNFTGNDEGDFEIGTSHRPSRVKKEKGRVKIKTILEAETSYNEPLFSSGSSDEYQPDSSSGEEDDVSLQVQTSVANKRVIQHKTSHLNRYIKVNQGDCSSEVAGIESSSNAEEVLVPDSDAKESLVPGSDAEESLVPGSDAEESLVPGSDLEARLVPGSDVEEALVNGKRKRRKGEDINSKDWARNLNAAKRRKGDSYLGLKKQENGTYALVVKKEGRKLKERCGCKNVRLFDCEKVSEIEREKLFTNFWKEIDSWEAKQATVVSLVSKSKPSFRRGSTDADNSRKSTSFQYHLKVGDDKVRVCKKMFLNTFSIGEKSVRSWVLNAALDKPLCEQNNDIYNDDPQSMEDNVQTPPAKDTEKRNRIRQFLNSLPKMESHYCRANTTKVYLEPMWESKSQLFREYVRNCQDKDVEPGSRALFHTIFQAMNIGFFLPKKDQCETCLKYSLGKVTDEEYANHQKRKVDARKEKDSDKKRGESSNQVLVYAVDVQKVLTCPDIRASVAYYKTKLKVHNWSAYNLATHDGTCYIWHEGNASLESDVFASMLVRFLTKELEKKPGIREIIIWSDGCIYQNRCENVANALLYFAIKKRVIVYQKYLEVGHTQMEVDSMHSIIEKKLKKQEHYVPADFIRTIRNARMVPRPYTVESLSYKDFSSFSNGYYKSIRPGSKKGDPFVTDLRCLKYVPTGHIFYKLNLSEEWSELPKRPKPMDDVFTKLKPLYSNPLSIQDRKFKDLQELKNCLEEDYHNFYDSLRHG